MNGVMVNSQLKTHRLGSAITAKGGSTCPDERLIYHNRILFAPFDLQVINLTLGNLFEDGIIYSFKSFLKSFRCLLPTSLIELLIRYILFLFLLFTTLRGGIIFLNLVLQRCAEELFFILASYNGAWRNYFLYYSYIQRCVEELFF